MLPDAAAAHYRQQQRLTVATLGLTRAAWARMTADFDTAWRSVGPKLALVALSAQLGAARSAEPYLAAVLPQVGLDNDPAGAIVPEAFVGAAGDGRPVDSLLYGAVTSAKEAVAGGAAPGPALALGGRWLDMAVHTLVADTSRAAVGVGVAVRPAVGGYVRMLNLPSCSRCVVLAGKFFRWNAGFPRHPRCDCRHIPSAESHAEDLTVDPRRAIESGRVTDLSAADRRAIVEDGADVGQVINARRGMYQANVLGRDIKATRASAAAGRPRLRPETVYREARDRDDAIRLLKANGYVTDGTSTAVRTAATKTRPVLEAPSVPATFKIGDTDSRGRWGSETASGFQYDPARVKAVHDPYISKQMRGAVRVEEPELRVMGGGAASGKSSIIKSGDVQLPDGHVLVNADEAKEMIPEYEAGVAARNPNSAAFVHEESSDMAKRLTSDALSRGYSTVLDGVGNGSIGSLTDKISRARADGARRIVGDYVTVDTDEAVRRALLRGERSGRFVPEDVIRHAHGAVSDTFREAAASPGLFDELRLWDNNGAAPRLIYSQVGGIAQVLDQEAYEAFLRKGPRYTP